jgi:hypothetical protein
MEGALSIAPTMREIGQELAEIIGGEKKSA